MKPLVHGTLQHQPQLQRKTNFVSYFFIYRAYKIEETRLIWRDNMILLHDNSKGPDQPANQGSLINPFIICSLESVIGKLATCRFPDSS